MSQHYASLNLKFKIKVRVRSFYVDKRNVIGRRVTLIFVCEFGEYWITLEGSL